MVASALKDWSLNPTRMRDDRRRYLAKPISFDSIVDAIVNEAQTIKYCAKRGGLEAKGHTRPEFLFSVTAHTYDVFFNSAFGYRAQFYTDHRLGAERNSIVLKALQSLLLSTAEANASHGEFTVDQVKKSLELPSAKIWINEDASNLDQTSVDADALIAIAVPHWVAAARFASLRIRSGRAMCPFTKHKALLGVQAPEGTELKVLGAWINDVSGEDYVVPSKRNRARQIRAYGFA
jgi:hypothetical protein